MVPGDDAGVYEGELREQAKRELGIRGKVRDFSSAEGQLSSLPNSASQDAGKKLIERAVAPVAHVPRTRAPATIEATFTAVSLED
jgi:hypothetical protein